ncbi:alpha/beta hydrolase family protein [Methylobacterium sp. Leaf118]|uniref:alpha/beta hydrolase family protein n=1 Tax=Methylobacterium sp. Leaf118 TaxID=2876562 RepID=UPI001E6500B1|nr:acetylhydrolase [Methylobacterium sp. Leaf118]
MRNERHPRPGFSRRRFGGLLVGGLATGVATRAIRPAAAASEDVRIADLDWVDAGRARPVPARLYWPSSETRAGAVPLIVFSHGLGQSRTGYAYLGRHWAANGYASLHVQHVGSDGSVWAGNPFAILDRVNVAADEREALARAADVSFALDRILGADSAFAPFIDRTRLVAAGHSYGANTTLILGGARVVRDGRMLDRRDRRFKAGIVISAPPFYGERDLHAVLGAVTLPTFHVTATADVIALPGRRSAVQDRLDVYAAVGTTRKALAVFEGGSHSIFTDRALTGGARLNPQVKQATAEGALAFLDLTFRDDSSPLAAWSETWRPILAVAPMAGPLADPSRPAFRRSRSRV